MHSQEMLSSVRVPVSLRLPSLRPLRLTKPRLLNLLRRLLQATRTRQSSKSSEEPTKPPRLPRPTSSEMASASSFGMPELLLVLKV